MKSLIGTRDVMRLITQTHALIVNQICLYWKYVFIHDNNTKCHSKITLLLCSYFWHCHIFHYTKKRHLMATNDGMPYGDQINKDNLFWFISRDYINDLVTNHNLALVYSTLLLVGRPWWWYSWFYCIYISVPRISFLMCSTSYLKLSTTVIV